MSSIAETMNFLNEAATRFSGAVSFLAGRPPDEFIDIAPVQDWIDTYSRFRGGGAEQGRILGQYSDTNGVSRDVLADYLMRSLKIAVAPEDCMMVNGAQEGMLIAAAGLCSRSRRALAADPTYVGFAGACEIAGVAIEAVPEDDDLVANIVDRLERTPNDIGCVYVIPDFANPTGRVLDLDERLALVTAAQRSGVVLVEDTAYRQFRYEGTELPTLYALSGGKGVVLIESFSKTVLPGLRCAVLAAGMKSGGGRTLAERFSSIKSYVSVASSPLAQAAVAGFLIANGHDLTAWVAPRVACLRERRNRLLAALSEVFDGDERVRWRSPEGGFFMTLEIGTPFSLDDCLACAAEAGVLMLPMRAFSLLDRCGDQVRLSFSNVGVSQIGPSIERVSQWLAHRARGDVRRVASR